VDLVDRDRPVQRRLADRTALRDPRSSAHPWPGVCTTHRGSAAGCSVANAYGVGLGHEPARRRHGSRTCTAPRPPSRGRRAPRSRLEPSVRACGAAAVPGVEVADDRHRRGARGPRPQRRFPARRRPSARAPEVARRSPRGRPSPRGGCRASPRVGRTRRGPWSVNVLPRRRRRPSSSVVHGSAGALQDTANTPPECTCSSGASNGARPLRCTGDHRDRVGAVGADHARRRPPGARRGPNAGRRGSRRRRLEAVGPVLCFML
jgi:hypothetical protein